MLDLANLAGYDFTYRRRDHTTTTPQGALMEWSRVRRREAAARSVQRLSYLVVAVCALALAGCNTDGQPTASVAMPRGATVAFDSIDGPPAAVFHKLVEDLNDEAQTRRMAVVSRESPSVYRVRGYLSAHVLQDRTAIAWVWDVYDQEQHRALRISGVERADGKHRTWAAADDAMLRNIARTSMDQLAAFLNEPENAPAATPQEPAITLASFSNETTPESAGIFRISQVQADPVANGGAAAQADGALAARETVPLPPRRPQVVASAVVAGEMLALAASRR
jgi:hypothetical protein